MRNHGSAPWLLGDMITGGAASYFGANKLFNKFSWLTKAIPMALAALPGGSAGMLAGSQVSRITANCIAKLSHPQIKLDKTTIIRLGEAAHID